ncbi:hypothetical protein [Streptomyces sp. NPDC046925]|uniref:hypothetical protein n=1 Tax=Streptomyces sp. NPDC046925 TaxID=3155375 RepID=UPI0033F199FF
MIPVLVSNNERDHYPALADPAECDEEGYVKPYFDLATVRVIAEDTQAAAAEFGHEVIDTVHVVDGPGRDGAPGALVVVICWMDLPGRTGDPVAFVAAEAATGRYAVGGLPWCWYAVDDRLNPLIPFRAPQ